MTKQLPDNPEINTLTRTEVLVAMAVTAIVLMIIAKLVLKFGDVSLISLNFTGMSILLGLGLGLIITVASSIIYRLWPAYRQSADFYLELVLKPLILPDIIWLGLLPGLSEELLFRGVMLPAVGVNWIGLFITSICFGVLHLSGKQQWPYVIWATIVGLMLGYSVLETGNLLVPIVAHILTNLLSSFIWKWEHRV